MKFYILILSIVLLSACSRESINYTNLKAQTLMHTHKQKLSKDHLSGIASLSYLNPVLDYKSKDEIFVLALAPKEFEHKKMEVFINNNKAQITPLEHNDELLKYLINNEYSNYYKVSISNQNNITLQAKVCLQDLPCFELNFQKYSKSLYYRSIELDTQYN
ncbi:hypothetical protein [Campylobacter sp. US33a]|uniref:Lipoprotein n=1 Tax=Campylobacter sp. CCS1377 TaxID=3158229 RepID=A0AAU7E5M3_9BACT|nr:hypothetical protein [Campylobacter sp. US33a]MCW1360126.1 hypothetical protein [Campylobacter jejuni]TEY03471.1 hypothetical protein ELQ16_02650 [Campylobacter sp. US33a]